MIRFIRSNVIIFMYFVGCYFAVSVFWKLLALLFNEPYTIQMSNTIIAILLGSAIAQLVTTMGYREEIEEDYDV